MVDGEVVVATLDGQPLRASFPLRVTVFGVEAVVIPEAEFRRLARAAVNARREKSQRPRQPSKLDAKDPELAAFVRERILAGASIEAAQRAAYDKFGRDRAPGWSVIQRFRLKVLAETPTGDPPVSIP